MTTTAIGMTGLRTVAGIALGLLALTSSVRSARAQDAGAPLRVLFIGSSLTYSNNLPEIVQALADSARGRRIEVASIALPDFALVDHWTAGRAQTRIAQGRWDVVVLQQGPSSTAINRDSLRIMAVRFDSLVRKAGARTALYSVWPTRDRRVDFARASESYRLAADAVQGLLFPVATAWLNAITADSSIALYSADGLHPSAAGSYLAGLVIYARLLDKSPMGLPATVAPKGASTVRLTAAQAAALQRAAVAALERPR